MAIISAIKGFVNANKNVKPMSEKAIKKYVNMSSWIDDDVYETRSTIANYLKNKNVKVEITKMSEEFDEFVSPTIEERFANSYMVRLKDNKTGDKFEKIVTQADNMDNFDLKTEQPITRRIFKTISDVVEKIRPSDSKKNR